MRRFFSMNIFKNRLGEIKLFDFLPSATHDKWQWMFYPNLNNNLTSETVPHLLSRCLTASDLHNHDGFVALHVECLIRHKLTQVFMTSGADQCDSLAYCVGVVVQLLADSHIYNNVKICNNGQGSQIIHNLHVGCKLDMETIFWRQTNHQGTNSILAAKIGHTPRFFHTNTQR